MADAAPSCLVVGRDQRTKLGVITGWLMMAGDQLDLTGVGAEGTERGRADLCVVMDTIEGTERATVPTGRQPGKHAGCDSG